MMQATLTPRQAAFAREYVASGNATQAARDAGYEIHGPETHDESGEPHLYASDPDGHAMEWWGKKAH